MNDILTDIEAEIEFKESKIDVFIFHFAWPIIIAGMIFGAVLSDIKNLFR